MNKNANHTYQGYSYTEITRLMLQVLLDMGFSNSASVLQTESGINLESPQVSKLRKAILNGLWDIAEESFSLIETHIDPREYQFLIRKQNLLEQLGNNDRKALEILRDGIAPLNIHKNEVARLSTMLFESKDIVQKEIPSREELLFQLQRFISPAVMIPEHRLATLLKQAQQYQIKQSLYHMCHEKLSLYEDYKGQPEQFPDRVSHVLEGHDNEVWHISFSHDGKYLASASADNTIIIWNLKTFKFERRLLGHTHPPVIVTWSPDDSILLSCGKDKTARLWDAETGVLLHSIENVHADTVSSCVWLPDGKHFVTTSAIDKTVIVWDYDCTEIHRWTDHNIIHLDASQDGKYLVCVGGPYRKSKIHVFDLETYKQIGEISTTQRAINVAISRDSRFALINFTARENTDAMHEVQLWDIVALRMTQRYIGNCQSEYVIRSCFGGVDDSLILSGSEDSRVYVWHRSDANLLAILKGHIGLVSCVKWHPTKPLFASAGDDFSVRIWSKV